MSKSYTYEFTIRLIGGGTDPEEAWNNLLDDGTIGKLDDYSLPDPKDIKVVREEEQAD
jgi:hypothetical protein